MRGNTEKVIFGRGTQLIVEPGEMEKFLREEMLKIKNQENESVCSTKRKTVDFCRFTESDR